MSYEYEYEQRRRIREVDWTKVHTAGDKGPTIRPGPAPRQGHVMIGGRVRVERGGWRPEERA